MSMKLFRPSDCAITYCLAIRRSTAIAQHLHHLPTFDTVTKNKSKFPFSCKHLINGDNPNAVTPAVYQLIYWSCVSVYPPLVCYCPAVRLFLMEWPSGVGWRASSRNGAILTKTSAGHELCAYNKGRIRQIRVAHTPAPLFTDFFRPRNLLQTLIGNRA